MRLTPAESAILAFLAERDGRVVTKQMIIDSLYLDGHSAPTDKIVDVWVCKIRKKMFAVLGGLDVIETSWGRGFRFIREGFVPRMSGSRDARAAG